MEKTPNKMTAQTSIIFIMRDWNGKRRGERREDILEGKKGEARRKMGRRRDERREVTDERG